MTNEELIEQQKRERCSGCGLARHVVNDQYGHRCTNCGHTWIYADGEIVVPAQKEGNPNV
jgi:predicted RNA-binding Zn-ribbon protein involved in translation (DUF1610 family)